MREHHEQRGAINQKLSKVASSSRTEGIQLDNDNVRRSKSNNFSLGTRTIYAAAASAAE
jgi:hypothetical protein